MVAYSQLSLTPVFHQGAPVVGAVIEIFDAGTLTPRSVFTDAGLTVPHARPIRTNASGRVPQIWSAGPAYRARISTPGGAIIEDVDGIPGDVATAGGGGGGGGTSALDPGDVVWADRTGTRTGYVRANGRTIGNAASGASERANDDCYNLFIVRWNNPSSVVSGGKGATADADWLANKTVTVADFRFRGPFGLDDMGNVAAGRATGGTFTTGNATTLGSTGGTASDTLTSAQIPAHAHTGTTSSSGNHQHTGTTAGAGGHDHGGTNGAGSHSHGGGTGLAGAHGHSASTDVQGGHSHGGGTGAAGGHSHTGSTTTNGNHNHTYDRGVGTAAVQGGGTVTAGLGSYNTFDSGSHSHGLNIDGVGDHGHSISFDGSHGHNVAIGGVGDHAHGIAVDGFHGHSIPFVGDHAHSFVSDAAGAHAHTFTSDQTGGGTAHNSMPPFVLGTWYQKL